MPDWQLTPEEEMFGDAGGRRQRGAADGRRERHADRHTAGRPRLLRSRRMVRPDGTGDPSQQELDQAFPPAAAAAASRARRSATAANSHDPRQRPRPKPPEPRPNSP